MLIKWTKEYEYDFPESELSDIAHASICRASWYSLDRVKTDMRREVRLVVGDRDIPWGEEQTNIVVNAILAKVGGIQLNMFEGEETLCGAIKEEE